MRAAGRRRVVRVLFTGSMSSQVTNRGLVSHIVARRKAGGSHVYWAATQVPICRLGSVVYIVLSQTTHETHVPGSI